MNLKNKSVLIAGRGVSGKGAMYALMKKGAKCVMTDGEVPENVRFDFIVVSPGLPVTHEVFDYALKTSTPIMGELEFGSRLFEPREVIAITGTNGKTTVTSMCGDIIGRVKKTAVCGNIGTSFAACAVDDYEVAVVETSSFQLETAQTFHPHIACITNIDCDHLDRHGSLASYAALKLGIAKNQTESDFLVLSRDAIPASVLKGFCPKSDVYYTALGEKVRGAYLKDGKLMFMNEPVMKRGDLKLCGDFNVLNALSAICVCRLYGISGADTAAALKAFDTAPHRLKKVLTFDGKTYWDDSKGTNIAATLEACKAMSGNTLLILGGSDKGYDYDTLFEKLPSVIKEIVTLGETAEKIESAADRHGFKTVNRVSSVENAVYFAAERNVDNVLLSPASASFDMFRDYRERGDCFIAAVKELKG